MGKKQKGSGWKGAKWLEGFGFCRKGSTKQNVESSTP